MKSLTCTRCGHQVELVEDVRGSISYGLAVIDHEGVVRRQNPQDDHLHITAVEKSLGVRACCVNETCQYQWRLRRRFDPLP